MHNFYILVLLSELINVLKCELSLEITKIVNGTETVVFDSVQEYAGRNMTLTCNLVAPFNDTTNSFDDELSWGWKHNKLQFNNVTDLVNLARDSPNLLRFFIEKGVANQAIKRFYPLFPLESGTYFCMSLKYKLFKIVKLDVIIGSKPDELIPYFKALDDSRAEFKFNIKGPHVLPKFLCTNDKFTCKSGAPCFNYEYVCDGVRDCKDGSDENAYLCGNNPCTGKRQCSNGRCISQSLCCNIRLDPGCTIPVKPLCCLENQDTYSHWAPPPHGDTFDYSNDFTDNVHWSNYEQEGTTFKSMWIAVLCMGVLIVVIICIVIRQYVTKSVRRRSRTAEVSIKYGPHTNTENSHPLIGSSSDFHPCQPHYAVKYISTNDKYLDEPPSYDEVVSKSVSPSQKVDA